MRLQKAGSNSNTYCVSLLLKNVPFLLKTNASAATTATCETQAPLRSSNLFQTNTLIQSEVNHGHLALARHLFDGMHDRNVVSWSILMTGYFHKGLFTDALSLFSMMNAAGSPRPNEYVLTTAISCCSNIRAQEEGQQCHAYALKAGFATYSYIANSLIRLYSSFSDMVGAFRIFEDLPPPPDTIASNTMISGLVEHGHFNHVLALVALMAKDTSSWDFFSFATVIGFCSLSKDLELGLQLHAQVFKRCAETNPYIGCIIVDMYGKCGWITSASEAFEQLPSKARNVVSWTAMMTAYLQNGYPEDALNLFVEMLTCGVRPNEFTFALLLNACAALSSLGHGDVLNSHIEKSGFCEHLVVGNARINMFSKSGSIDDASKVFSSMLYRDVISWNSMISGYSHHGLGAEALEIFQSMLNAGELPNYVTFVGVLFACSLLGLVNDGFYILDHMMKDIGVTPGLEHYTCIVALLSRAGLLEDAERFMRSTSIDWDVVAWRTLLCACQNHRDFNLGKRVAKFILELDPTDVGAYILSSNMFAKAGHWEGVIKVRRLMRGREIKKEPGVSWIQLRTGTHVFVSNDKSHPQWNQIHEKLSEILTKIRLEGYVPDISNVLHDVEDEQKEEYLLHHSEKLAVAFGFIGIPSGVSIHVMKNLRVCDDCHTAMKLISKVSCRKIIIRDANRFHCFENGLCSCKDYW